MKFPYKLWSLVNECISGAIGWGMNGDTIFIDYSKFEMEFLSTDRNVFKTKNVVSFVRQLNLYGFRKCNRHNDVHEFKNPYFIRDRKDLLKLMKRKLKYAEDFIMSPKNAKMEVSKLSGEDRKHELDYQKKKSTKEILQPSLSAGEIPNTAVPGHSSFSNFSLSQLQDLNALPCGWWGNAYDSCYSMNNLYAMNRSQLNAETPVKPEEEGNDIAQKKNENSYWRNLDLCNNIVFVPVPAQYALYPGFINGNMPFPFPIPAQNEEMNNIIPQV